MPNGEGSIWRRYRDILRRRPADDVSEELRFHLAMRVAEAHDAGLSGPDARAAALERFGSYETVEAELLRIDHARDRRQRRMEWLHDIRQDAQFAVRFLVHAPSFAVAAIATLAIAIGANTAIYSVVHALLLAPLPYAEAGQLVSIWGRESAELLALREQLRSVSGIAAYGERGAVFDNGGYAEHLNGADVSGNFFTLLGSRPLLGRTFRAEESDPGRTNIVMLSEALWHRRFGSDSTVIGRRILLDGVSTTVVGVMPNTFAFPSAGVAFWKPFEIDRSNLLMLWVGAGHDFVARLRPGVSLQAARGELKRVAVGLRRANTVWDPGPDYGKDATITPLRDSLVGSARPGLLVLSGCAALVLLIACVNVANLLLARASSRERELAVRAALGGGRGRLVRQLLVESVVLAMLGATFGVALAAMGVRALVSAFPPGIPRVSEISVNGAVFGFTAGLTILAGLAFGILPAFRATRASATGGIARMGRTGYGAGHQRISAILVAGEVALAVMVLVGAELLGRSLEDIQNLDPGFRTAHIATAQITPPPAAYKDAAQTDAFYATVFSRVSALPGVESVGATSALPLAKPIYGAGIRIEGQFEDVKHVLPMATHFQVVTPGYMRTLGIPITRGRDFTEADRPTSLPVALVSESMARRFWPTSDPIGKRIGYPYPSPWLTVVGVVGDAKADSLRDTSAVAVYVPYLQRMEGEWLRSAAQLTLVARTTGDPLVIGRQLRALVSDVDKRVPVSNVQTMSEVVSRSVARPRFLALLVGGFALVALVLGAVGIYGVMSYVVGQRAKEMGVRSALGATRGDIVAMILLRAAAVAGIGSVIGVAAALLSARGLRGLLFGVSTTDPVTYVIASLLFAAIAIVASLGPAWRATRVDLVRLLRGD